MGLHHIYPLGITEPGIQRLQTLRAPVSHSSSTWRYKSEAECYGFLCPQNPKSSISPWKHRGAPALCVLWALLQTHPGSSSLGTNTSMFIQLGRSCFSCFTNLLWALWAAGLTSTWMATMIWNYTEMSDNFLGRSREEKAFCLKPHSRKIPRRQLQAAKAISCCLWLPEEQHEPEASLEGFYHVKHMRIPLSHEFKIRI